MAKRICIIGAGASGITCIKECLASGFDVVCYEKGSYVGGLWHYHDADQDDIASVMFSTIINSSKEMSAYSDFPPPKHLANYMHNSEMIKYLESYAHEHQVEKHVHFSREVIKCVTADDFDKTGRWTVTTRHTRDHSQVSEDTFDGVMVCTGHHVKPLIPSFKGQEKFRGKIVHTHSYKKPTGFENQNVVVVGVGNSGGDAAAELSTVGRQVYWSTRRGVWMLYRVGPGGAPFDSCYLRRYLDYMFKYTPYSLTCAVVEARMNERFDHERYGLKPKHRIFGQHPMVNDALPNRILSGTVKVKTNIQEFTDNGVIFEGESTITPVDSVILATGYEVHFPFLSEDVLWTEDNKVQLYKYQFNQRLAHPETLAFIGLIQAVGPAIPISEMQARWYCHLMAGKSKLPSVDHMVKDIQAKDKEMAARYFQGPRHTMQIDWISFLDEIAEQFGARPNLTKLAFTDPKLWYHLMFGPCLTYQYRLTGPGAWSGARKAILEAQDRIDGALETKANVSVRASGGKICRETGSKRKAKSLYQLSISLLIILLSYLPWIKIGAKYGAIGITLLLLLTWT
ncbi:Flavin-containing monooxygenase 5 [Halotydeus destructor]|nr:Flavin-containing monooxygenase 5 [Halotydeus destructor]